MAHDGLTTLPDFNVLLDIQRKHMEALSEASQLALEGCQAVVQRQTEILSQITGDACLVIKEIANEGTAEEKAARQVDLVRKAYEKFVANWHELADLIVKSRKDAAEVIHDCVSASLTELKSAVDESGVVSKGGIHRKAA